MSICPYCDYENIEGTDECEQCHQSLSDLHLPVPATAVERALLKDRIRILEPKQPYAVPPNTSIREVLKLLVENSIGCVVVVEDKKAIGIFSERDALQKLNTNALSLGDRPVSEFMTPNPQILDAGAKIAFAVQRMDVGGYRHLPIVAENGDVTGIVSVRDILRYLTDTMTKV